MKNLEQRLNHLIAPAIRNMQAYQVADATGLLKLDAMESPYTWSDELKAQWLAKLQHAEINRYPDPTAQGIVAQLKKKYQLPEALDVLLGNGSDEIIQLIIMAVAASGQSIMAPSPSFVMYKIIAEYVGLPFVDVPLSSDFDLDIDAMLASIEASQPAVIFLATPNNPTANVFSDKDIKQVIEAAPGLVVLDEAYTAFTDSDQLHWLNKYQHVLVMRTFSKIGLAGLRLGFLMGAKACLQELDKLRLPYNINVLTQCSVEFALENFSVIEQQSQLLREQRQSLKSAIDALEVFECMSSEANFLVVRCKTHEAKDIFEQLKQENILIKCLHGGHPLLEQCLRITVSTAEENALLLQALKKIIKK